MSSSSAPAPAKKQRHGPPQSCPHCGKEMRSDNLRAHIRAKHAALAADQTIHSDASSSSPDPADLAGSAILLQAAASAATGQRAQLSAFEFGAPAGVGAPVAAAAAAFSSSHSNTQSESEGIRPTQLRGSLAWGTPCVFDPLIAAAQRYSGACLFAPWVGDDPLTGGKPTEADGRPCPPLLQLQLFEAAAVSYRRVPLALVHTDPSSGLCRASPRELYRGEWPDDWRLAIPRALALAAAAPVLCNLPQPVDLSTCAFAARAADGRMSIYATTAAAARHPFNLDSIADHALSMLSLVPDCAMPGFHSCYAHAQTGLDHLKLAQAPLRAPLVAHVLRGKQVWFVVPHEQHDRALEALVDILAAHFQLAPGHGVPAAVRRMLLIAFHSQRVFVHPDDLRRRGVTVQSQMLHAGQLLYLRGDCVHWSLNQADQSLSLCSQVLPESWLEYGPAGCLRDAAFLQALVDGETRAAAVASHHAFAELYSPAHLSAIVQRILPQSWVCHLFHVIATDIERHLQRLHAGSSADQSASASPRFAYTLPEATLRRAMQTLRQVYEIMHEPAIVALAAAFGVACLSDPSRCHFRRGE